MLSLLSETVFILQILKLDAPKNDLLKSSWHEKWARNGTKKWHEKSLTVVRLKTKLQLST